MEPRVYLDTSPLRDGNASRGIGTYVRGLVGGLRGIGALDGLVSLDLEDAASAAVRHWTNGFVPKTQRGGTDICTVYDLIPLRMPLRVLRPWRPHAVARYFVNLSSLRRASRLIAISDATRIDLMRLLRIPAARIDVTPLGIDARFSSSGTQISGAPFLLYVGPASAHKNVRSILEAQASLAHRDIELWIAGVWTERQCRRLVRECKRLGTASRVRHLGRVSDADLPSLYRGGSVFVFPSAIEGFGLPVLEAMACGTPVVTSSVSALAEVAEGAAILVPPGDARSLAGAIDKILSSPATAATLRTRGIERAAQFSWESTARRTLEVYEQAMAAMA